MISSGRARALGLLLLLGVTTAAAPSGSVTPGITYDVTLTQSAQMPVPGMTGEMRVVWRGMAAADGSSRMDIVAAENTMGVYTVGDYMLTLNGRPMLVHPATKTYVDVIDMGTSALANMPAEALAQIAIGNVSGKLEKIGSDEVVEGRKTTHYRSTVGYTMNMMGQEIPSTIVSDYWLARLPVRIVLPTGGGNAAPASGTTAVSGPMAEIQKKTLEVMPPFTEGTAIKSIMETAITMPGASMVMRMTTTMTNIKEGDVDASNFVLPTGYSKAAK